MSPSEIRDAISADPALLKLAQNDPPDTTGIANALSEGRVKTADTFMISARGLAGRYAGGALASEVVMLKLEGARDAMLASTDPQQRVFGSLLRRQLGFLAGEGLNFGDPTLRGMLDQFSALGIITAAEAGHLKALANVPDPVGEYEVRCAIFTDDGKLTV